MKKYGMHCIERGGSLLPFLEHAPASVKANAVPYTDQVEHSTVLEEHIQELLERCRALIQESKYCIAQSQSVRERSRELVAASKNLLTN